MIKEKIKKFFAKKENRRKTKGQSLVEMALTLPIFLILLSGLVEFGFMLNYYLSLVDATREVARTASRWGHDETVMTGGNEVDFYTAALGLLQKALMPADVDDTTQKINIVDGRLGCVDPEYGRQECDEMIVSVYGLEPSGAVLIGRHHWKDDAPQHGNGYFDVQEIDSRLEGIVEADRIYAGIVVIEVYYNYNQVLHLPWLAMVPNPFLLHAYTIMPLSSAEPEEN